MKIKNILKIIINFLFPYYCANCHMLGKPICDDCFKLIEYTNQKHKTKLKLSNFFIATSYNEVMENLITEFKYRFVKKISKNLCDILITSIIKNQALIFLQKEIILVPVPLTNKRMKWRGFNQSEEICKELAKVTNQKIENLLIRIKNSKPQAETDLHEREENVKGVFKINKNSTVNSNSTICIVDDLITSGSTITEAAKILKDFGYKNIYILCVSHKF